ncbi:hypothetical protein XACG102_10370002 [Xanthomonas citri pv. citri]|nr:hypothetical protein XACG102_10370002 [Xanthomonas citri pv. citri]
MHPVSSLYALYMHDVCILNGARLHVLYNLRASFLPTPFGLDSLYALNP